MLEKIMIVIIIIMIIYRKEQTRPRQPYMVSRLTCLRAERGRADRDRWTDR